MLVSGMVKTYSIWKQLPWNLFRIVFRICRITITNRLIQRRIFYGLTADIMAQLVSHNYELRFMTQTWVPSWLDEGQGYPLLPTKSGQGTPYSQDKFWFSREKTFLFNMV